MPTLTGASKLELLFRRSAGLDVDKSDLRRFDEFLNQKLYDLLLMGQVTASSHGRDLIEPYDLPITKGLQNSLREFKQLDVELELEPILEQLETLPRLDLDYTNDTRDKLPEIAGALAVCLARTFKILDPDVKNPQTRHWDQAIRIFNLLL
ncbi:MAG: hypothetical protein JWQ71_3036 [Pedosphaera sp.]|nr:hypothetical protein [Pedosphaera sp.]